MLVVCDNGDNGFGATFCYAPGVTTKSVGVPGVWVKKATGALLRCVNYLQKIFAKMTVAPSGPPATVLEDCLRVRQSGVIRVLVALVHMIASLWARVSKMRLLGELGIFFILLPRILCWLGVFCARFPPREANYCFTPVVSGFSPPRGRFVDTKKLKFLLEKRFFLPAARAGGRL
jgi:hypothetical protein